MDGGIKFDVSADTAKFDADMARVGNVATRASDKVKQAFSGLGGLLAGGAIVAGLKSLMNDFDAERTEQILAKTRDINQQMSISEDILNSSLGLEKEKTAELAKQAEQLAKQEAQRQNAIRDIAAEVALIEAKLSGNKKLEESLREQADFQSAFDKTNSFEDGL
jgi:predicted RND superfamily exporter protein